MGDHRWCREADVPKGRIPARMVADCADTGKRNSAVVLEAFGDVEEKSIPKVGGISVVAGFVAEFG